MKITIVIISCLIVGGATLSRAGTLENWEKHCAKCHGPDGKGNTKMGKKAGVKDMTSAEYKANLTDDKGMKAVKEGLKQGGKELMKPNNLLSETEVKDLIAHVRQFK